MGYSFRLSARALTWGVLSAGVLAEVNYRRLPRAATGKHASAGKVSIVIPARDEERRLGPLLRSLQQLEYGEVEILVVDDGSTDGTARLARELGAKVLTVSNLPPGWTGKSHACWLGAGCTTGEWILFTDADTVHGPRSLSSAVWEAETRRAGLVSLLCRQRCESFWERVLLPYAYALYFAGRIQNSTSVRSAVANGQYVLIRRSEYERSGGHYAVRNSVVEDVALAQHARASGTTVVLLRGEDFVDVRMYDGLTALWEGLSKNAARFMTVAPLSGAVTVGASLAFVGATLRARTADSRAERFALLASPCVALLPWTLRFGVPVRYVLLFPFSVGTFQAIALDSIRRSLQHRGVVWKGRRY